MNRTRILFVWVPAVLLGGFLCPANAAVVYGGTGIGFADQPNQWVANVIFTRADKADLKAGVTASFHTGQDLTPTCADGISDCPQNEAGMAILRVPATSSRAWCDPQVDPVAAQANTYHVLAAFDEPNYNDVKVPRDTVFRGYFQWDASTKALSNLRGIMNQVMVSTDPSLILTHLLHRSYDPATNSVSASVFRNDSTAIFQTGSYEQVPSQPITNGTANAFFTLNFNATDPTSVTQSNIDKLVYGDCIGGSLMNSGTVCMSGLVPEGSMSGYPQSLTITRAATAGAAEPGGCYGSAVASKWAVIDLNGLRKAGARDVWVTITASRHDDGVAAETGSDGQDLPGDDDLVPALTVFHGRQDVGAHGYWYPNRFQASPEFWAWKLKPFHTGPGASGGWASASGSGSSSVSVSGKYLLKAGNLNYLTVAVGGDGGTADHDVNFALTVAVSRRPPKTP